MSNNNNKYKKIDLTTANPVSFETAKEFIDHRINLKKPLTQLAFDRAMSAAARCRTLGIDPDFAVQLTIDMGWQGIVFSYIKNELNKRERYETDQRDNSRTNRSTRADQQLLRVISQR